MSLPAPLVTAILLWKRGYPLPLDLETKLMSLGFDVPALETRYSR
jgi:hypothetical protein